MHLGRQACALPRAPARGQALQVARVHKDPCLSSGPGATGRGTWPRPGYSRLMQGGPVVGVNPGTPPPRWSAAIVTLRHRPMLDY